MKVGKSSNIDRAKDRVRSSIVDRNTVISRANSIEKVSPVERVKNDIFSSYNFLTASDHFYDKLKNLKEEYEDFYHKQQELEEAIKNLEYDESIIENMGVLVERYNSAIKSLRDFDQDFGTSHFSRVTGIVDDFRIELFRVGIIRGSSYNLIYDKDKFKEKLDESEDTFKFIFEPVRGLIVRLYRAFRNIKAVSIESEFDERYNERLEYEGMMLDQKG